MQKLPNINDLIEAPASMRRAGKRLDPLPLRRIALMHNFKKPMSLGIRTTAAILSVLVLLGNSSESKAFEIKLPKIKVKLPNLPIPRPQGPGEVIFPVCWGAPQDCRSNGNQQSRPAPRPMPVPTHFFAALRAQCYEWNGTYRGDTTVTSNSNISIAHARQQALNYYNANYSRLCSNIHPNTFIRGSAQWVG